MSFLQFALPFGFHIAGTHGPRVLRRATIIGQKFQKGRELFQVRRGLARTVTGKPGIVVPPPAGFKIQERRSSTDLLKRTGWKPLFISNRWKIKVANPARNTLHSGIHQAHFEPGLPVDLG